MRVIGPTEFMIPGGIDDEAARELAAQINAGKADADRICRICILPDYAATEIARQIDTGEIDSERLSFGAGLSVPLAAAITKAIKDARA